MMYNHIHSLDNVITTSYSSFDKALKLGLLIYYNQNSELNILSTQTFENKCKGLEWQNSYYNVIEDRVFFKSDNELKMLDKSNCLFKDFCISKEENIAILSPEYCLGTTFKRTPKISRSEIISTSDNQTIYKWEDEKVLVKWMNNLHIFQTKFKGNLYSLDVNNESRLWEIDLDCGIPGKRYLEFLQNDELIVQRYFNVDKNNLLRLDLKTGSILWELERTFSFYNYNESTSRLYGLGGKIFEAINAITGKRELHTELEDNLHITPHLTYYDNGSLYFSGHRDQNIPIIGAVNVENGKLIFTKEIEVSNEKSFRIGLDRPVVIEKRLYIRDSLKTLHIYEREES